MDIRDATRAEIADEMDRAASKLERAYMENESLRAENERLRNEAMRLRAYNEGVRVCRDHTKEIVSPIGACVICENERLKHDISRHVKLCADLTNQLERAREAFDKLENDLAKNWPIYPNRVSLMFDMRRALEGAGDD